MYTTYKFTKKHQNSVDDIPFVTQKMSFWHYNDTYIQDFNKNKI